MTSAQFEEYLESIGGLIDCGFSKERKPLVSRYFFGVDDGWLELLRDLIDDLMAAGWTKEIVQVKEKFAGLRFYALGLNKECDKILSRYEDLAAKTCEKCGKPGNLDQNGNWMHTFCEEHMRVAK